MPCLPSRGIDEGWSLVVLIRAVGGDKQRVEESGGHRGLPVNSLEAGGPEKHFKKDAPHLEQLAS